MNHEPDLNHPPCHLCKRPVEGRTASGLCWACWDTFKQNPKLYGLIVAVENTLRAIQSANDHPQEAIIQNALLSGNPLRTALQEYYAKGRT